MRRRKHNKIDAWDEASSTYRRAFLIEEVPTAVAITQRGKSTPDQLVVEVTGGPRREAAEVNLRSELDRLLGLSFDPSGFNRMAAADPDLGPIVKPMLGTRPPRFPTVFEALLNGVACQQISLEVGIHLLNRITDRYGLPVAGAEDGPRVFPGPGELAGAEPEELRQLGFSFAKSRAIIDAARALVVGELDLERLNDLEDEAAKDRLIELRGVGRWTAEYILLRGLGRVNVIPGDDVGAQNKLRSLLGVNTNFDWKSVNRVAERWRPYAGLVYFHLLLNSLLEDGTFDPASSQ